MTGSSASQCVWLWYMASGPWKYRGPSGAAERRTENNVDIVTSLCLLQDLHDLRG